MRTTSLLLAGLLAAAVLAGCTGGGSAGSASPPPDADATVDAKANVFQPTQLTLPAGKPAKLFFRNLDGVPHNVAIYVDASAAVSTFVGEVVTDTTIVYDVPALGPGAYFFRCDVHPEMRGTVAATAGS